MNTAQSAPRLVSSWIKQVWFDTLSCITPSRVRKVVFMTLVIVFAIGVMRFISSPSVANIAVVMASGPVVGRMFHSARVERQKVNLITRVAEYLGLSPGEVIVWDSQRLRDRAHEKLIDQAVEVRVKQQQIRYMRNLTFMQSGEPADDDDLEDYRHMRDLEESELRQMFETFQIYGLLDERHTLRHICEAAEDRVPTL